jgi:hypothetical protein
LDLGEWRESFALENVAKGFAHALIYVVVEQKAVQRMPGAVKLFEIRLVSKSCSSLLQCQYPKRAFHSYLGMYN